MRKHNVTEAELKESKRAYEAGESIASVSRRLGVAYATIRRHAEQEGWIPARLIANESRKVNVKHAFEKARAEVIDIATKKALESSENLGIIDHIAKDLPRHVLGQAQLAEAAMAATKALLAQFIYEMSQPLQDAAGNMLKDKNGRPVKPPVTKERADTLASLINSGSTAVRMSRDIEGRKSGVPSIIEETAKEENTLEIISRRIEPVRVAVDDGGRALIDGNAI